LWQQVEQRPLVPGVGRRSPGADREHRRQVVGAAAQLLDQWTRVRIADHRHHADLLALRCLENRAGIEFCAVIEHDGQPVE